MRELLRKIEEADEFEIQEIMDAVKRWYVVTYPDWDIIYTAVHKDPKLRKKELEELVAYIEKDLQWYDEYQKKDSLE